MNHKQYLKQYLQQLTHTSLGRHGVGYLTPGELETMTLNMQAKFPGRYQIEEYYDGNIIPSWGVHMVFETPSDETAFLLRWSE